MAAQGRRLGGEWDQLEGEASRAGASRNDQDRYYLRRTFEEIANQPGTYAVLLVSNSCGHCKTTSCGIRTFSTSSADAMPLLGWLPSFGVLLALAATGLVAARPREPSWLLAYAIAILATLVFLVIGTRYRMPIVPVVIAVAGGGVAAAVEAMRSRRWNAVTLLAGVCVVTWLATEVRRDAASHNVSEEWAFTGCRCCRGQGTRRRKRRIGPRSAWMIELCLGRARPGAAAA